jgi:gliding motility-associated lipoprotein GldD
MRIPAAIIIAALSLSACKPPVYTPKRMGYYRLELPANHRYVLFNKEGYPFSFEYPSYGSVFKDTQTADSRKPENKYWLNIDFPQWGGRIYLSYKRISPKDNMAKLLDDTHEMSYYHTKRADYINPSGFENEHGVDILTFSVGGDAASAYQFIAMDSTKHYLRGALYFDVTPNADSLKPVNDLLKKDIDHLISTLRWNE